MKVQVFINHVGIVGPLPEYRIRPGQVVLGSCHTDRGEMALLRSIDGEYFLEDHRALYQITDTKMIERRIRGGR